MNGQPDPGQPEHGLVPPLPESADTQPADSATASAGSYFETYARQLPPPPRFPNIVDVILMAILLGFGWLASAAVTGVALHFHLFGVTSEKQAFTDIHYTLGGQAVWYVIAFLLWMAVFPAIWREGFLAGIQWRAAAAIRLRWRLLGSAFACFVLAVIDGFLMPGPKEAPIDEVFKIPGAAWLLFAFGITLAPFFEEMVFRGFLLPALATAWDWTSEKLLHRPPPWPDENGATRWSLPAMVAGSVLTSIPFALMHAEQTANALGPFLLLVCVSLVLCWVRLSTRSLAASTLVHACYNLILFSFMLASTGGFRHLDKM